MILMLMMNEGMKMKEGEVGPDSREEPSQAQ
jgi:hypothetical protein